MRLLFLTILLLFWGGCAASLPKEPKYELNEALQLFPLEQMHQAILEFRTIHGKLPTTVLELQTGIKSVYSHSHYWERFKIVAHENKKLGQWDIWAIEIEKLNPHFTVKLLNTDRDTPFYSE